MLFALSKEIRVAKGDKREEKRGLVSLWYSGGQTFFSSGKFREYVQANQLDSYITVGWMRKIFHE